MVEEDEDEDEDDGVLNVVFYRHAWDYPLELELMVCFWAVTQRMYGWIDVRDAEFNAMLVCGLSKTFSQGYISCNAILSATSTVQTSTQCITAPSSP